MFDPVKFSLLHLVKSKACNFLQVTISAENETFNADLTTCIFNEEEMSMGHIINSKGEIHRLLADRLNKNPVGAPVSEDLMEILHRLYTEHEARIGAQFPMIPMTLEQIAGVIGMEEEALKRTLDDMAVKGLVVDIPRRDGIFYLLAPMIHGFF